MNSTAKYRALPEKKRLTVEEDIWRTIKKVPSGSIIGGRLNYQLVKKLCPLSQTFRVYVPSRHKMTHWSFIEFMKEKADMEHALPPDGYTVVMNGYGPSSQRIQFRSFQPKDFNKEKDTEKVNGVCFERVGHWLSTLDYGNESDPSTPSRVIEIFAIIQSCLDTEFTMEDKRRLHTKLLKTQLNVGGKHYLKRKGEELFSLQQWDFETLKGLLMYQLQSGEMVMEFRQPVIAASLVLK